MSEDEAREQAWQAFKLAYEAEHPNERAAFFAGLEASEPFIRAMLGMPLSAD
jgi:hypothetical protein